ncbi:glycerophosphoryl diester phosphodiesterase 2 [Pyrus ussuriensis x Pyrus communis]|uniref:glycerophosphodiester phosphodiesterase n=1 Tax=Pyrus ussuriensis x Pyrus communis TaxID=2448454 RepID=A0A5N5GCE3_9ROSA|nr:glycerophosphoryl diester phosphodiesterase 2 [Pyrus ussuriensis x Pyrus communis]
MGIIFGLDNHFHIDGFLTLLCTLVFLLLLVGCSGRPIYPLPSKAADPTNRQPLQTSPPYNIGADFIETDILSLKDGVLICFHEVTLDDTTDVAEHKEFTESSWKVFTTVRSLVL